MTETAKLVIAVDSSGAKNATRDLDRLAEAAGKTEKRAGSLKGALAGAFIGTGIVVGINAIVRATIEAEKAQAQLGAVLKSTKGAAGLTAAELNTMAGELQKVTTFGDEAIIGAQSMLLTFTKIGKDTFPQATEAVLDLSTALGTDLKSASIQVGKALNDPIQGVTALGRAGVQFTDDQKKVIKALVETGRTADAQRIILAELETQMGGSARAARDTLGGALTGLQEAFGDLLEGDASGGGIKGTKDAIEDLTAVMQSPETKAAFASMVGGLADVVNFAVQGTRAIVGLYEAVQQRKTKDAEKSYEGLLAKRAELEDRIGNLPDTVLFDVGGARGKLESELAAVDALITARRASDKAAANAAKVMPWNSGVTENAMGAAVVKPPAFEPSGGKGAADYDREAAQAAEDRADATQFLFDITEQMRAELAGPTAQVNLEYARQQDEIIKQAQKAGWTNEQLAESLDLLEQKHQNALAAIEEEIPPNEQLIQSMESELELMRMTNEQREKEIALRQLDADATEVQKDRVKDLIGAMQDERAAQEQQREAVQAMDQVRYEASDALQSLINGTKSAKEAFSDFFDSLAQMITQRISDGLIEQLFGNFGTTGQGSTGGGLISSLFGMFGFGGGKATGGRVGPSNGYVVGENGPEWFQPDTAGNIVPADRTARMGGGNTTINVNVPGATDHRSASQIAQRIHEKQQMYSARFA